jgi:hypothetical protein
MKFICKNVTHPYFNTPYYILGFTKKCVYYINQTGIVRYDGEIVPSTYLPHEWGFK